MVKLGMTIPQVRTALDLEQGLQLLQELTGGSFAPDARSRA